MEGSGEGRMGIGEGERLRGRRLAQGKEEGFTHTPLAVCAVATSPRHRAGMVRAKTLPQGPLFLTHWIFLGSVLCTKRALSALWVSANNATDSERESGGRGRRGTPLTELVLTSTLPRPVTATRDIEFMNTDTHSSPGSPPLSSEMEP